MYRRRLTVLMWLPAAWLVSVAVAGALALTIGSSPAFAHAQLLESEPQPGSRLQEPPEQIRLHFSEPVDAEFEPIEVLDEQGERVDRDNARLVSGEPETLVMDLEDLPESAYTVDWRVTSADGHVVAGKDEFSVTGTASGRASQDGGNDSGAAEPDESGQASATEEASGGLSSITSYSSASLAIAVVIALVLVGTMLLRRDRT